MALYFIFKTYTYLRKFFRIKSLTQYKRMSRKIFSSSFKIKWFWLLVKNVQSFLCHLVRPTAVAYHPFSWDFILNVEDGRKYYPTSKDVLILRTGNTCLFRDHTPRIGKEIRISNSFKILSPLMLFFCTQRVWTVPLSPEPVRKTLGIGRIVT